MDCNGLGNVNGVAASVGYAISTGNNLRASSAIASIGYKCHDRYAAVVSFIGNDSDIRSRHIGNALDVNRSRVGSRRIGQVMDCNGLGNVNGVAARVGYAISTSNNLRARSAIASIGYECHDRYAAVVSFIGNDSDIRSRHIGNALDVNRSRVGSRRIGQVKDCNGLGNVNGVAASVGYAISTSNNLRASSAIANIGYECHDRYAAVVSFIGNDSDIRSRHIGNALDVNRSRVGSRRIGQVKDCNGLGNVNGVAAIVGYAISTGNNLRASSAIASIGYECHDRYAAVVSFIGNDSDIRSRYIGNALNVNRSRVGSRRIGRSWTVIVWVTLIELPQESVTL